MGGVKRDLNIAEGMRRAPFEIHSKISVCVKTPPSQNKTLKDTRGELKLLFVSPVEVHRDADLIGLCQVSGG